MRVRAFPFALAVLAMPATTHAQTATLQARTDQLLALLGGKGAADALFAPAFLTQVPAAQVNAIAGKLAESYGKPLRAQITPSGPNAGKVTISYERGSVDMQMQLDAAAPNLVTGLLIVRSEAVAQTTEQVIAALRALPGATGFAFARLADGAPTMLAALEPDRPLATGSMFKLVILAELVRATGAGERQWTDMVTLDGHPLPQGTYTQMPAGAQVTLLELAQKMISISDNSATDLLLGALGREKVEAMMAVVGWQSPARNRPFLTTSETFKIKGIARFRQAWPTLDEKGRRALLIQIDAAPLTDIDPALFQERKPNLIDQAEWFASPADLVRTMDWLRKHTESGPAAQARAILSINPGIGRGPGTAQWSYIGYKGGSEPGVIGMTYLLQSKGGWYVVSAAWNDPQAAVDDGRFAGLMMGVVSGAGR